MSKRMSNLAGAMLSLVFAMFLAAPALAQSHPVEGSYNVTSVSSELGTFKFVMVLKKDGAKWTGEVKESPTPLNVTSVAVDEMNKVTVIADAGGTAVTINGKFADNKLAGDWSAGDIKGTWSADKKDAATSSTAMAAKPAASAAPAATGGGAAADIAGSYDLKVVADGQGEFSMTLIIKNDGGKLVTSVENGGPLNVTGIEVKDGDVTNLTATYEGNGPIPLIGKRTGSDMGGKWEFSGFSGTWSAKKKK